jgi:hypothetical protein
MINTEQYFFDIGWYVEFQKNVSHKECVPEKGRLNKGCVEKKKCVCVGGW